MRPFRLLSGGGLAMCGFGDFLFNLDLASDAIDARLTDVALLANLQGSWLVYEEQLESSASICSCSPFASMSCNSGHRKGKSTKLQ
jgi:hypothetical protein